MFNRNTKVMYFEAGLRKFKVERVTEYHYKLTVVENGEKIVHNFKGSVAYEQALIEVVSYAEIDEGDFEED